MVGDCEALPPGPPQGIDPGRLGGGADASSSCPLGYIGAKSDIANAVLYLASDESKFMTGAEIKVDGGISAM